jgi:hypothetical protein
VSLCIFHCAPLQQGYNQRRIRSPLPSGFTSRMVADAPPQPHAVRPFEPSPTDAKSDRLASEFRSSDCCSLQPLRISPLHSDGGLASVRGSATRLLATWLPAAASRRSWLKLSRKTTIGSGRATSHPRASSNVLRLAGGLSDLEVGLRRRPHPPWYRVRHGVGFTSHVAVGALLRGLSGQPRTASQKTGGHGGHFD